MAFKAIACWGDPATAFQLDGQSPIERRPADDRLWDYATGHLGFYGYLRVANTRILLKVGLGLMNLSDRLWRDHYEKRQHPGEAADEAITDEAADMGCDL